MKIIKSFFFVAISLCATNLLHAQEALTTPVKPVESKPADIVAKPAPAPALQPGSTAVLQTATDNVQAVPSDPKKEENIKTPGKTEVLQIETKTPTTTLKAKPAKEQPLLAPNTNDPNIKRAPVTRSAAVKQQ